MFNDTWEDPFLTNQARVETKESTSGGRIALERIFGGPLAFKYAYATNDVKDEHSGTSLQLTPEETESLLRDGVFHRAEIDVMLPVATGLFMRPTIKYTNRNAEGEANSYDEYIAQLSMLSMQGKHTIVATISLGMKQFDMENPIFNANQDSK